MIVEGDESPYTWGASDRRRSRKAAWAVGVLLIVLTVLVIGGVLLFTGAAPGAAGSCGGVGA
jgi:hypothetical protein